VNTVLSAAESGMLNDVERLRIISHNLANVSTVGFKRELAVTRPFAQLLSASSSASASGGPANPIITPRTSGSVLMNRRPSRIAVKTP